MEAELNSKLTAAEVAQIWSAYMNSSMSKCMVTYYLNIVEDQQVRSLMEHGLKIEEKNLEQLAGFFQRDGYPVPFGFKVEEDVNLSAPRLFSDVLILRVIHHMGNMALKFNANAKAFVVRPDIDTFFKNCVNETNDFNTMSKNLLEAKGLYNHSPYLIPAKEVHFVKNTNFLSGLFGKERPLTAIEIDNLFANSQRNAIGQAVMTAWSQAAQSKEVAEFMLRGKEIASKHVKVFDAALEENDLPVPLLLDDQVTDSTESPFSDKLLMFATTTLTALSIGFYGTSLAISSKKDVAADYVRLSAEIASYGEDGAKIMIENGWMEEPPLAPDRDKLAYH